MERNSIARGTAMGTFVTFGEIMLRLNTVGYERYVQAKAYAARTDVAIKRLA